MSTEIITSETASDALLKLCKAKDGLVPYSAWLFDECPGGDHVSCGLDTAIDVMAAQLDILQQFIDQQGKMKTEV